MFMGHWMTLTVCVYDFKPTQGRNIVMSSGSHAFGTKQTTTYKSSRSFEAYIQGAEYPPTLLYACCKNMWTFRATRLHDTLALNSDARIALLRARTPLRPGQKGPYVASYANG